MPRPLTHAEVKSFREQLCSVATERFAERGYEGVTLRGLARDVGCSPMTPYRYFANKDEIFAAVRAAAFGRFADACQEAVASADTPLAQLAALGRAYLGFALAEPHAYRIMFELGQPDELAYPDLAAQAARSRRIKLDVVEAAIRSGDLQGDAIEIANLLWASLHGVIVLHLAGKLHEHPDLEGLSQAMMDTLVRGLRARSQQENTP